MRFPDKTLFWGLSMKVFSGEISIWNNGLSKEGPQCGWASANELRAWIEQKTEIEIICPFWLPACLLEFGISPYVTLPLDWGCLLGLQTWTELYHRLSWISSLQRNTVGCLRFHNCVSQFLVLSGLGLCLLIQGGRISTVVEGTKSCIADEYSHDF